MNERSHLLSRSSIHRHLDVRSSGGPHRPKVSIPEFSLKIKALLRAFNNTIK
jgi:hypothetical protein